MIQAMERFGLFFFMAIFSLGPVTNASAQTINVTIGGTPLSGSGSVPIKGTYGNIQINDFGGTARVEAPSDGTSDNLALRNAQIVALGAVTNYTITFTSTLNAPPSAPSWYHGKGTGKFWKSTNPLQANVGDSVTLDGWTGSPLDQIGNQMSWSVTCITCGVYTTTSNPPFKTQENFTTLANPRQVKGEVKFTLTSTTSRLNLTEMVAVKNGPAPGGGDGEDNEPVCEEFTPKSREMFLCDWFNWFCPKCAVDDKYVPSEDK
jgi:hypothetical protein